MEGSLIDIMKCYANLKASYEADKRMLNLKIKELELILRSQEPKIPQGVDYDKIASSRGALNTREVLIRLQELKSEINTFRELVELKSKELENFKKEMKKIKNSTSEVMFKVYYYRYVEGIKSLEKIALKTNYDYGYIKNISSKLGKFDFIID